MDDSLAPGNAHIIRVIPVESEDGEEVDQDSEFETESLQKEESDIEDEEEVMEKEHDLFSKEDVPEKIPETEVVTFLVCGDNQQLADIQKLIPGFSESNSKELSPNLHLNEASKISKIIQATPLMSKVVEKESKVEKDDLKEQTDMLYKIAVLERKVDIFRDKHEKDRKEIKNLLDSYRRHKKKIAVLQDRISDLKQLKHGQLKQVSPSILELIRQRGQNKKAIPKEYSLEVREFAKKLYSISPHAYRYIRNYFDMVLPHEKTIFRWKHNRVDGQTSSYEEDLNGLDSTNDDCVDMQSFCDEDDPEKDFLEL